LLAHHKQQQHNAEVVGVRNMAGGVMTAKPCATLNTGERSAYTGPVEDW